MPAKIFLKLPVETCSSIRGPIWAPTTPPSSAITSATNSPAGPKAAKVLGKPVDASAKSMPTLIAIAGITGYSLDEVSDERDLARDARELADDRADDAVRARDAFQRFRTLDFDTFQLVETTATQDRDSSHSSSPPPMANTPFRLRR